MTYPGICELQLKTEMSGKTFTNENIKFLNLPAQKKCSVRSFCVRMLFEKMRAQNCKNLFKNVIMVELDTDCRSLPAAYFTVHTEKDLKCTC